MIMSKRPHNSCYVMITYGGQSTSELSIATGTRYLIDYLPRAHAHAHPKIEHAHGGGGGERTCNSSSSLTPGCSYNALGAACEPAGRLRGGQSIYPAETGRALVTNGGWVCVHVCTPFSGGPVRNHGRTGGPLDATKHDTHSRKRTQTRPSHTQIHDTMGPNWKHKCAWKCTVNVT